MSSFVITKSGKAPDRSVLLILVPVTTTFWSLTTSSSPSEDSTTSLSLSVVSTVWSSEDSSVSGVVATTSSPGLSARAKPDVKNNKKNKEKKYLIFIINIPIYVYLTILTKYLRQISTIHCLFCFVIEN